MMNIFGKKSMKMKSSYGKIDYISFSGESKDYEYICKIPTKFIVI